MYGELARQIRAHGFDAISAYETNMLGISDEGQLQFATSQGRAILTHNSRDYEPLHKQFLRDGKIHYGIVVFPQWNIGKISRRILRMLDQVDADQMKNTYHHLGEFK